MPLVGLPPASDELAEAVAAVVRARQLDWVSAADVAAMVGVSPAQIARRLRAVASALLVEARAPDTDHRQWRYRPNGHVPRRPDTEDDWDRLIGAHPELTSSQRKALGAGRGVEGVTTLRQNAARAGMTLANYFYHLERAYEVLGFPARPRRKRSSSAVRRQLVASAIGNPCPLCGHVLLVDYQLALDHIVPFRAGGSDTQDNLRVVHWICNLEREGKPKHRSLVAVEEQLMIEEWRGEHGGDSTPSP